MGREASESNEASSDAAGDASIVHALRTGQPDGFDRAYKAYRARIYAFLLRMSANRATAEDLLQETWLRLAKSSRQLRENTNLRAWLFTVARNLYRSHARRASRKNTQSSELEAGELIETATPHTLAAVSEEGRRVEAAMARLSPSHREVLLLIGVEDMTPSEASLVLGQSPTTTRKRLSRARAILREELVDG